MIVWSVVASDEAMVPLGTGPPTPESGLGGLASNIAQGAVQELIVVGVVAVLAFFFRRFLKKQVLRLWQAASDLVGTWASKAGRFWPELLFGSLQAAVASVIIVTSFKAERLDSPSIFLVLVTGILAVYVVVQEYRFARKASYAEALRPLHMAVHILRDRTAEIATTPREQYGRILQDVVDAVAQAFSIVTRTNCRACIKVISLHPNAPDLTPLDLGERARHLLVTTAARNSVGPAPEPGEQAAFLNDNTDFEQVFLHIKNRWFISNDLAALAKRGGYFNSHLPADLDLKRMPWPLLYRSALVWPIRRIGDGAPLHPENAILGFLCVDSFSRNVFSPRYDFDAGALVADALYSYMRAYASAHPAA